MRLVLILVILLGFPILEISILIRLGEQYGWWVGVYLLASASLGWLLIQEEKLAVFGRLYQVSQGGQSPIWALITSASRLFAGVMLILPGVITDVIALLILLIPTPKRKAPPPQDDVIEGEFRREE
jgi:UPF0716 protein FxsA